MHNILKDELTEDIKELLSTLVEICELAYAGADKRTSKSVLRMFNITFKHAVLLTQLFPKEPKKITRKKLFGIYFHSITCHLPEVSRIIAPSSLHSENEERMFSDITSISRTTSSRTDESVRDNAILRLQMEMEFQKNKNYRAEASKISKLSKESKFIA